MENVRFWETVTCVIIEKHKRKQGKKMKILAFDTSSTALSVALLEDEKLVAESTVTVKKNHSISLMPTIDFLVAQAGWDESLTIFIKTNVNIITTGIHDRNHNTVNCKVCQCL